MDTCTICGISVEEPDVCCVCGEPVCSRHARIPDPEIYPQEELLDYCLDHYVEAGYAEIWEVSYWTTQGDIFHSTFDTPPGTHPFKIPGIASKTIGGMFLKVCGYNKKVRAGE